jgi:hypothetical protein
MVNEANASQIASWLKRNGSVFDLIYSVFLYICSSLSGLSMVLVCAEVCVEATAGAQNNATGIKSVIKNRFIV